MTKSYVDGAGTGMSRPQDKAPSVRYDVGPYILTMISLLFITRNARATHRLRTKAAEFLNRIDEALYEDNADISWCLALAKAVSAAVMKGHARDLPAIESRVLEDTEWAELHVSFFDAYHGNTGHAVEGSMIENELSDDQVRFVDEYISTRLRYSYLWQYAPVFREIIGRLDGMDMGQIAGFSEDVLSSMESLVQKGRSARSMGNSSDMDFRTGDVSFEAAIRLAWTAANQPQSTVKTGIRLLNDMLSGGYEGGRCYVHLGRSGDWKSGLLCSVAWWATDSRFNPEYRTKDPTRHPVVLFISQENDPKETIERMISFALGSDVDLKGSDPEDMARQLGEAYSTETCKFSFKYRQDRSITTADIDSMIEDEYMDGNEVVLVIHDYIKRIRSVEQFRDQRHLELGAIVNEESSIAKKHGIPFVTGMQLTREAYAKIEAAMKAGKTDAVKEIGASQVGESINVFENADVIVFQSRVTMESTGTVWLTMRLGKMRGKRKAGVSYFAQPFDVDAMGDPNEMSLARDAHLHIRECRGVKDLGDGMSQEYSANEDAQEDQAGGRSREDRRADRAEVITSRAGSGPPRRSGPIRRSRSAAPAGDGGADAISANAEIEQALGAGGLEGL
jgi:hypothetical protein